jgi:hypothetical protein
MGAYTCTMGTDLATANGKLTLNPLLRLTIGNGKQQLMILAVKSILQFNSSEKVHGSLAAVAGYSIDPCSF